MKKIVVSSLVSLLFLSCSVYTPNNSTQDGRMPHRDFRWSQYAPTGHYSVNFSDLEKEYKSFSTKALSDAYVKRMFGKYLGGAPNSVQLTRQLEFSRYLKNNGDSSYETSLKGMFVQTPSLYNNLTEITAISDKMTNESGGFGSFVQGLSPYALSPVSIPATSITQTSYTANWNSFNNAIGYKLYLDGSTTPITLGLVNSYSVTGLTKGTPHNYYVKAILNTGDSPKSDTIMLYTSFDEFHVNTYTTNNQDTSSIAMSDDGKFVVAWQGYGTGDNNGIFAQKYNADGSVNGPEFRVNTYTTNSQQNPSVAMANDGSFVVTWEGGGQDGDTTNIYNTYAQKYNADGSVNGPEFRANSYTNGNQLYPSIAMADDGKFVITWYGGGPGDTTGGVFAQKYNADGSVNGSEFRVNTYTTGTQTYPSIAIADDGKFVITWQGPGQGDTASGIFAQRYNADGSLNGSEFRANSYTTGAQETPSISMAGDGKFVITWQSAGQDGDTASYYNIYAQKYNADGSVNDSEFRINSYTTNSQTSPSIAMSDNGKFIISWESLGQDDSPGYYNIFAQKYNADGSINGSEFRANSYTTSHQWISSVATDNNGNFVITWKGTGQGGDFEYGIYAKRYDSNGNVL